MRSSRNGPIRGIRPVILGLVVASASAGCGEDPASRASTTAAPPGPVLPAMWGVAKADGTRVEDGEDGWPFHRDARIVSWRVMALVSYGEATGSRRYRPEVLHGVDVLRASQWDESRGCPASHPLFGGISRVGLTPPDLTHTALALQAQRNAGVPADDPWIRRALGFIARCQVAGTPGCRNEGGFAARPIDPATSAATAPESSRKPSGATTCLGLTSLLAAGFAPEDARVRGALRWLAGHYTLDAHPGMDRREEGLFGFYLEFAKAMAALRLDRIRDAQGVSHDWCEELAGRLAARQNPDGSWTNPRESPDPAASTPMVVTSYALLTLDQIRAIRAGRGRAPGAGTPAGADARLTLRGGR